MTNPNHETRIDYEPATKQALIARIKVAAEALDIPADAVADVIKRGTKTNRSRDTEVLCEFSRKHGVSLDWLVLGYIAPMLRYAATMRKICASQSTVQPGAADAA